MPSVAQRQKRSQSRQEPHLLMTGAWSVLSDGAPDFGPEDPPPDAVAAGQTVRVVKDVVRVGRYFLGYDAAGRERYWNITPQTLAQIVANFKAMQANGQRPNLGKTHGDLKTLLIHPDDLMAPIDDLKVSGDTLWMSAYVTPEDQKYLANPARKVSIGSLENYSDSENRRYPGDSLLHVAVTDRPAVNGQGPFLSLADAPTGGGSMNPDLLDAINMLMEAAGLSKLGEVTDETDLISQLKGVSAALGKTVETSEPPADGGKGGAMPEPPMGMAGIAPTLANKFRQQASQIKSLTDRLAAADKEKAEQAKASFMALCDAAVREGAPKASVDQAKALAAKLNTFDPELVAMIPRTLSTRSVAKTLADPNPATPDDKTAERKERAERLAARRGISVEAAMAVIP